MGKQEGEGAVTTEFVASIGVLFVRRDSVYKTLPGCDCYDADRDALTFGGGMSVVAHPPCRLWGRLRHMAKSNDPVAERRLALWAVAIVRKRGGVLEHPASSTLWEAARMALPGDYYGDQWDGRSICVDQFHWGHRARKRTWLYVCGVGLNDLPAWPMRLGEAEAVITRSTRRDRSHVTKREREATPIEFARWLCQIARLAGGRRIMEEKRGGPGSG